MRRIRIRTENKMELCVHFREAVTRARDAMAGTQALSCSVVLAEAGRLSGWARNEECFEARPFRRLPVLGDVSFLLRAMATHAHARPSIPALPIPPRHFRAPPVSSAPTADGAIASMRKRSAAEPMIDGRRLAYEPSRYDMIYFTPVQYIAYNLTKIHFLLDLFVHYR